MDSICLRIQPRPTSRVLSPQLLQQLHQRALLVSNFGVSMRTKTSIMLRLCITVWDCDERCGNLPALRHAVPQRRDVAVRRAASWFSQPSAPSTLLPFCWIGGTSSRGVVRTASFFKPSLVTESIVVHWFMSALSYPVTQGGLLLVLGIVLDLLYRTI